MADDEDAAGNAEMLALLQGLANGERAYFWGAGETKDVGEPRLTLWQEGSKFRLSGRDGTDFGAFGSIQVAFRFMEGILTETGDEG